MSSGSKEIPGVYKARNGKKGFETMMGWISFIRLRSALSMSSEMRKLEWQRQRRFAFLRKHLS